jgi:hypothetical protein
MTTFGKSIRLYLKDGNVTGIKTGEVVNQTIQAIACPRPRAVELKEMEAVQRPGVYFLFGTDEQTNESKVYIGEAENVYERLQSHIIKKDFWNEVIFFTSKDENLTKSHVKYLESRLIQLAFSINRYKIDNYNQPQASSLPLPDRDSMEEFLLYVKLLIGVLGHKVLEEVISSDNKPGRDLLPVSSNRSEVNHPELFLSMSGLKASAIQTDEGIVVLKGSEAAKTFTSSLSPGYQVLREKLINSGSLVPADDKYVFQKDTLFDAPTPAGAIVVGYNMSGPQNWKDITGKSLKEIEEQRIQQSPSARESSQT